MFIMCIFRYNRRIVVRIHTVPMKGSNFDPKDSCSNFHGRILSEPRPHTLKESAHSEVDGNNLGTIHVLWTIHLGCAHRISPADAHCPSVAISGGWRLDGLGWDDFLPPPEHEHNDDHHHHHHHHYHHRPSPLPFFALHCWE